MVPLRLRERLLLLRARSLVLLQRAVIGILRRSLPGEEILPIIALIPQVNTVTLDFVETFGEIIALRFELGDAGL